MRKRLFPWLPIPAGREREHRHKGLKVGWGCESGRRWVFGCGFDAFRGRYFDGDWGCFGGCEGGKREAVWKNIFKFCKWRVRTCGMYLEALYSDSYG